MSILAIILSLLSWNLNFGVVTLKSEEVAEPPAVEVVDETTAEAGGLILVDG